MEKIHFVQDILKTNKKQLIYFSLVKKVMALVEHFSVENTGAQLGLQSRRGGRNFENLEISKAGGSQYPLLYIKQLCILEKHLFFSVCCSKQNKIFRSKGALRSTRLPLSTPLPEYQFDSSKCVILGRNIFYRLPEIYL